MKRVSDIRKTRSTCFFFLYSFFSSPPEKRAVFLTFDCVLRGLLAAALPSKRFMGFLPREKSENLGPAAVPCNFRLISTTTAAAAARRAVSQCVPYSRAVAARALSRFVFFPSFSRACTTAIGVLF